MLVNMNEILRYAEEKGCCVGAFDTPNLEILMAVLRAAEKRNEPVIIQHAQLHEPEMPIRIIGPIMVRMAKEASVPVCAMLDHGEDMDYVRTALELGFSAVMIDGSSKPYDENVSLTREAVALAKEYGASVEAEIGIVTGHEGREFHIEEPGAAYTNPAGGFPRAGKSTTLTGTGNESGSRPADGKATRRTPWTGTTRRTGSSGGRAGRTPPTIIWKPPDDRNALTCVPIRNRGLIKSLPFTWGLRSARWRNGE